MIKSILVAAAVMVASAFTANAGTNLAINDAPAAAKTQNIGAGASAQGVKVRIHFGGHHRRYRKRIRFHHPRRICRHWLRKFHRSGHRKFLHRYKRCLRRARYR